MPTTPSGTRTCRSSSPLGSREPRTTSPTGSGRAISWGNAAGTPASRSRSSRSRSSSEDGVPSAAAASTSAALAASTSSDRSSSASAIAASAASLVAVGRVRSTRAASRARWAAAPISGKSASDTRRGYPRPPCRGPPRACEWWGARGSFRSRWRRPLRTAGHSVSRIEKTTVSRREPSGRRRWLRSTASCLAPSRAIAVRDWWLCQCVRNSTARQPSTSKACVSSSSLLSALTAVRWADAAVQVAPISSRGTSASALQYVVSPTTVPSATRRTTNGSIVLVSWRASRFAMSAAMVSGDGTEVYQSSHSRPSDAAVTSSSWWSARSGSRVTVSPVRITGSRKGTSAGAQGAEGALAGLTGQPVEEERAVEVVHLVLERAGHQPAALQPQGLAVHVEALHRGVHGAHRRRPDPRHREAALVAVLGLLRQLHDHRVDHVPHDSVDVVGEGPQAHPDLRSSQPGPAGVVDGLQQVTHQGGQVTVEGPHLVGGRAEHGVTELADGADGHAVQSLSRWSASDQDHLVAVDDLPAVLGREVPGLAAQEGRHLPGVVGGESAGDDGAVRAHQLDGVVAQEAAGDPGDPGVQQRGVPLPDRTNRPLVEQHPAAGPAGVPEPELARARPSAHRWKQRADLRA